jgi:hypothetical protein
VRRSGGLRRRFAGHRHLRSTPADGSDCHVGRQPDEYHNEFHHLDDQHDEQFGRREWILGGGVIRHRGGIVGDVLRDSR